MEGSTQGQQLGRYQQVATLGQGGMGTVYLALASGLGQFRKLLVVKELRQDLTRQKGFIRLFMDEAKLAARLSHPNVVQTFEAFKEGNRYLLAMEYLDGQSLSALIVRTATDDPPRFPLGMHIHILCEVLAGLHYAHELRDYDGSPLHVVHRDVSPQNVFVTYHGEVKVVDFGVAKAANAATSTAPGIFVGKFGYAAPEQILGRPVDARTDVFAVGVMLWQAIAQRRFSSASPTPDAFRARTDGSEPRIRAIVPDVDPNLADICDRAMALDPGQRFASAQEFRTALLDYMDSAGIRVLDSHVGQLMQGIFEQERKALHAQIEAAVQVSGTQSNVEALSFLTVDKEPTAVADLSNLVDVSLQREDAKIRAAYAHTKVTRLPSQRERIPTDADSSAGAHNPRRWLYASLMVIAIALLGVLFWSTENPSDANPEPKPLPPSLVAAELPAAPESATRAPQPPAKAQPPAEAPVSVSEAPKPTPRTPAPAPKPNNAVARRARPTPPPARVVEPAAPPSPPVPVHSPAESAVKAAPAADTTTPARVEAGSDLGTARRPGPARIDLENPYQ